MYDDSTASKQAKYPYPPGEEILAGVQRVGSINALAREFGIPEKGFHQYLSRRPELRRRISAAALKDTAYPNQYSGPKYGYPDDDEIVALFEKHGYKAAVAREIGVSRGCLRSYVEKRPELAARIAGVGWGGGRQALQKHPYPDDGELATLIRGHKSLSRVARALNIPQPNLYDWVQARPHLRRELEECQWRHSPGTAPRGPDGNRILSDEQKARRAEYGRQWRIANQNRRAEAGQRRRAKEGYPDEETIVAYERLRHDPCSYCGGPGGTVDHIVPLNEGGEHHWTNLTAACGTCNSSKATRSLLTFLLYRRE